MLACTVKSRPSLGCCPAPKRGEEEEEEEEEEEKEGKEASCLVRAGLSSYLYRLFITCVHLSMWRVASTPPQQRRGQSRAN